MSFNVRLDNQPEKFLKKADKSLRERLCKKIETLREDPISHDAQALCPKIKDDDVKELCYSWTR